MGELKQKNENKGKGENQKFRTNKKVGGYRLYRLLLGQVSALAGRILNPPAQTDESQLPSPRKVELRSTEGHRNVGGDAVRRGGADIPDPVDHTNSMPENPYYASLELKYIVALIMCGHVAASRQRPTPVPPFRHHRDPGCVVKRWSRPREWTH